MGAMKRRERSVRIADLKASLSKHLRAAQRGQSVTVLDRDTPIARIVPVDQPAERLVTRPASLDWHDVELPPRLELDVDLVRLLREDRDR